MKLLVLFVFLHDDALSVEAATISVPTQRQSTPPPLSNVKDLSGQFTKCYYSYGLILRDGATLGLQFDNGLRCFESA